MRNAEEAADEAERLRLYYVAMTRAIDKLIVAGSVDSARPDPKTPIGWVLDRLQVDELDDGEVVRGEARLRLRVDRFMAEPPVEEQPVTAEPQLALFDADVSEPSIDVPPLPPLEPVAVPPVEPIRRLSYSALALFEAKQAATLVARAGRLVDRLSSSPRASEEQVSSRADAS